MQKNTTPLWSDIRGSTWGDFSSSSILGSLMGFIFGPEPELEWREEENQILVNLARVTRYFRLFLIIVSLGSSTFDGIASTRFFTFKSKDL